MVAHIIAKNCFAFWFPFLIGLSNIFPLMCIFQKFLISAQPLIYLSPRSQPASSKLPQLFFLTFVYQGIGKSFVSQCHLKPPKNKKLLEPLIMK